MERVDTITDVKTKELPPRDGQPPVTLYLLTDSAGREYSTRNRDLARVGHEALERKQYVHLEYDEKKGGQFNQFTNRYLNSIELVADGTPTGFGDPPGNEPDRQPPGLFDDADPGPIGRTDTSAGDKDLNIAKAVGLKAGVEVLQYLPPEERTVSNVITAAEYFTTWLVSWRP
jgi:hypothetical protein